MKSKLVETKEYHYSEKGKEVLHYSIANKYIIIAPKGATETIKDKLMKLIPVAFLVSAATLIISIFSGRTSQVVMKSAAPDMMPEAALAGEEAVRSAYATTQYVPPATQPTWLWFLVGSLFALFILYLVNLVWKRMKK